MRQLPAAMWVLTGLLGLQEQLLCPEGDPTRLTEAELALDVDAELAPPPFDEFLLQ
jgi:hypothetical protein